MGVLGCRHDRHHDHQGAHDRDRSDDDGRTRELRCEWQQLDDGGGSKDHRWADDQPRHDRRVDRPEQHKEHADRDRYGVADCDR